jgi:hypothetical protein
VSSCISCCKKAERRSRPLLKQDFLSSRHLEKSEGIYASPKYRLHARRFKITLHTDADPDLHWAQSFEQLNSVTNVNASLDPWLGYTRLMARYRSFSMSGHGFNENDMETIHVDDSPKYKVKKLDGVENGECFD